MRKMRKIQIEAIKSLNRLFLESQRKKALERKIKNQNFQNRLKLHKMSFNDGVRLKR